MVLWHLRLKSPCLRSTAIWFAATAFLMCRGRLSGRLFGAPFLEFAQQEIRGQEERLQWIQMPSH